MFALVCLNVEAQEYKEGLLYDVTGPVKELSTQIDEVIPRMLSMFGGKASFRPDGKCENSITKFDAEGYPLGFTIDDDTSENSGNLEMPLPDLPIFELIGSGDNSLYISYNVEYDDNHTITSSALVYNIDIEAVGFKKDLIMNMSYQYKESATGAPEVSSAKAICKTDDGAANMVMNSSYSDYVYDEHGNWISRNGSLSIGEEGKSPEKTYDYVETRSISYYD